MNSKLIFIFGINLSVLFASTQYDIKINVKDTDKRYRAYIELSIDDNNKVENAKFTYPDFDCESINGDSASEGNIIEIEEKIIRGHCVKTTYDFIFNKDGDSKKISSIEIIDGNKKIDTTILSMKYQDSNRRHSRNNSNRDKTYYSNGNLKCKTLREDNEIIQVKCYYEDGERKNIINFFQGKAKDGKEYYRNGQSREMTVADFHNLGYEYHEKKATNNNADYNGQLIDITE